MHFIHVSFIKRVIPCQLDQRCKTHLSRNSQKKYVVQLVEYFNHANV